MKIIILNKYGFVDRSLLLTPYYCKFYKKLKASCTTITTISQCEQLIFSVKILF